MIPLVGYFTGDFIPQLFLCDENGSVAELAEACAAHVVGLRVAPREGGKLQVEHNDKVIDDDGVTVNSAGIAPMDVVYVGYR